LGASSEQVVGDLFVVAPLSLGYEMLRLFFTDRRIIVSRSGKVGAASIPSTFMFGSIGGALSGLFGGRKHGASKRRSEYPTPEKLLSRDRDNFFILFDEVVGVDLTQTPRQNRISISSRNDKFDFTCGSRFEQIQTLFSKSLGGKVRVHYVD
jgi:hypothetical protein